MTPKALPAFTVAPAPTIDLLKGLERARGIAVALEQELADLRERLTELAETLSSTIGADDWSMSRRWCAQLLQQELDIHP